MYYMYVQIYHNVLYVCTNIPQCTICVYKYTTMYYMYVQIYHNVLYVYANIPQCTLHFVLWNIPQFIELLKCENARL